jgi:hypothetical protein
LQSNQYAKGRELTMFARRSNFLAHLAGGILAALSPLAPAQNCETWSRVIDDNSALSVSHEYKRARDQFCSATRSASTYESANSAAQNAGLSNETLDGIFKMSFNNQDARTSSSFSSWQSSFCNSSANDSQLYQSVSNIARTFSANARAVAEACYASTTSGLKGKITVAKDKKGITIDVRYQPNGIEPAQLEGAARIVPRDAVVGGCDPDNLFGKDALFGNLNAACMWDPTKNVQVQLNTKDKKYWPPLMLDADPPPVTGDIISREAFSFSRDIRCSAPTGSDKVECTLWTTTYMPKAKNTTLRAIAQGEVTIGVSEKGGGTPPVCSGNAETTDPWRAGWVILKCGDKENDPKDAKYPKASIYNAPSDTLRYSLDAYCGNLNGPVKVELTAMPRGCSRMGKMSVNGLLVETLR